MSQLFFMFFLLLSNIAAGLAFLLWKEDALPAKETPRPACGVRTFGLVCSLAALLALPAAGLPESIIYLSLLSLLLGLTIFASRWVKHLTPAASAVALLLLVYQGFFLRPAFNGIKSSMLSVTGVIPLLLLTCGSLAMGAELLHWFGRKQAAPRYIWLLRICLACQLLILALVPCAGENAAPALQFMGLYWMDTQLYWAGVLSTGVSIGLTFMGKSTLPIHFVLIFFSMFCVRISLARLYFLIQ